MDTLSDVLRAVRLTGAVYFHIEATSPWAAEAPPAQELLPLVLPGVDTLIEFHVLATGSCWAGIVGEPPVRMGAGDVIAFPQGSAHVLSSAPAMRAPVAMEKHRRVPGQSLPFQISVGGPGTEVTTVVCGFLGCDAHPFNPLLAALPRLLHLPASEAHAGWVGHFIQYAVAESKARREGSEAVLARLSELMFVDLVRRYVETMPPAETGWLAALRDAAVGRALAALHARPAEPWTLESLAKEAALSRSSLHERFAHFVGMAPIQYLAQWRMQLAARRLVAGGENIATIAFDVGYESEAAFSRAFKKLVGVPPSAWRERRSGKTEEQR